MERSRSAFKFETIKAFGGAQSENQLQIIEYHIKINTKIDKDQSVTNIHI
jgi:hypothetical protein